MSEYIPENIPRSRFGFFEDIVRLVSQETIEPQIIDGGTVDAILKDE